jgi:hypothetical protein
VPCSLQQQVDEADAQALAAITAFEGSLDSLCDPTAVARAAAQQWRDDDTGLFDDNDDSSTSWPRWSYD